MQAAVFPKSVAVSYGKTWVDDQHAGNDNAGKVHTEGASYPTVSDLPIQSMICIPRSLEYLGLILLGSPSGDQEW
jgi:hypothetical protein